MTLWYAGKNWGVDKTDCEVVSAQGSVAQELVCPIGTLLTEIHDDLTGFASGIQKVGSVTCCTLHVIAEPTLDPTSSPSRTPSAGPTVSPSKAPTTTEPTVVPSLSPSRTPSTGPSVSPSKAPTTTEPTVAPSLSPSRTPSVAPTVAPTKAPTSIGDCLLQNRATARTDEEYLRGLARCLPSCDEVPQVRRALEGRLLQGGVFLLKRLPETRGYLFPLSTKKFHLTYVDLGKSLNNSSLMRMFWGWKFGFITDVHGTSFQFHFPLN